MFYISPRLTAVLLSIVPVIAVSAVQYGEFHYTVEPPNMGHFGATVEPPNMGHFWGYSGASEHGANSFVPCREVVLISEVK